MLPALRRGLDVVGEQMRRLRAVHASLAAQLAAVSAERDAAAAARDAALARLEAAEAVRSAAVAQRDAAREEAARLEKQVDALVTVLSVTLGEEPVETLSKEADARQASAAHDEVLFDAAVADLLATTPAGPDSGNANVRESVSISADAEIDAE